jgi:hypothetical protein
VSKHRSIIVVPDGDVGAKAFGSPHVKVYNRVNFTELIHTCASPGDRVRTYSLPHTHMSNLIAIVDKP